MLVYVALAVDLVVRLTDLITMQQAQAQAADAQKLSR